MNRFFLFEDSLEGKWEYPYLKGQTSGTTVDVGKSVMRPLILITDEQNARVYVRASKDE